jgi:hypothetical protein
VRNISNETVKKFETNVLNSVTFFRKKKSVYGRVWVNIVQPDRSQMTIWHMRIAGWIPKATNTQS